MFLFATALNALGRFYRAGLEFTAEGCVIDVDTLAEGVLDRLEGEANLHLREATDDEIAAFRGATADDGQDDALHHDLMRVIPHLEESAFGKAGPKVDEVRKALPETDPKSITGKAVKTAFEELVNGGFTAPVANT